MWTWILSVTRAQSKRAHKAKDKVVMTCCVARWPPVHLLESVFLTLDGADATLHLLSKECHSRFLLFPSSKWDTKVAKCSSVVWYWCQISQPVKLWMWCCLRGVLLVAICNILTVSTYNSVIVDPNGRKDLFATLMSDWIETKLEPYWFHVDSVLLVWGALTWWL